MRTTSEGGTVGQNKNAPLGKRVQSLAMNIKKASLVWSSEAALRTESSISLCPLHTYEPSLGADLLEKKKKHLGVAVLSLGGRKRPRGGDIATGFESRTARMQVHLGIQSDCAAE